MPDLGKFLGAGSIVTGFLFAGVIILKEPMSITLFLGAVLILVGIRQVTKPDKKSLIQ